jgi:transcriptional regulator with XRE-family HTH domain
MSHKALAVQLKVSENSVSNWTTGRFKPAHQRGEQIAGVLGMTLDELHGRSSARPSPSLAAQSASSTQLTREAEAERIVRQLATIDLDGAIRAVERVAPPLMEILASAREYSDQRRGSN